jgi:ribosome-associated translation inhibitor RaiA
MTAILKKTNQKSNSLLMPFRRMDMDLFSQDLMYEFHAKELTQTEALKQYADHAVKEIKTTYGWDTDVQINIEPEAKNKHLFSVSMSVFGLGEPVVVKKDGKQVMSILRKVRKAVMRQIRRLTEKRVSDRRKVILKEQVAS